MPFYTFCGREDLPTEPKGLMDWAHALSNFAVMGCTLVICILTPAPASPGDAVFRTFVLVFIVLVSVYVLVGKWRLLRQVRAERPAIRGYSELRWKLKISYSDADKMLAFVGVMVMLPIPFFDLSRAEVMTVFLIGLVFVILAGISWHVTKACPAYIPPAARRGFPVAPVPDDESDERE
ncbi:MAG: hypothetical protein H6818_17460 [Phycisphaerales bacterium]|nr:hypothetical protein [Phycisphaerales bacterium]MCB9864583.1 hypothetical protein [Phycisphaerales bacterium]